MTSVKITNWKWKEYYEDWTLKYEWNFKNGEYDGYGIEYYPFPYWTIWFEWEYKNWYWS